MRRLVAIANAEDERDVEAMKNAKAEEKEELADFNEEEPGERGGDGDNSDGYAGKVESVALAIESELTSVQRYALHLLEAEYEQAGISLVETVHFDKESWEKDQLRRIRAKDADRLIDEDEILYYEVSGCSQQVRWRMKQSLAPILCARPKRVVSAESGATTGSKPVLLCLPAVLVKGRTTAIVCVNGVVGA